MIFEVPADHTIVKDGLCEGEHIFLCKENYEEKSNQVGSKWSLEMILGQDTFESRPDSLTSLNR
jgi:hypothetical protein